MPNLAAERADGMIRPFEEVFVPALPTDPSPAFRSPWLPLLLAALICPLLSRPALAHATGESYVWLNVQETHLEGRFEIALSDLEEELGIATPPQADQARQRIAESADEIERYLEQRFAIAAADSPVPYSFTGTDVVEAPGLGLFAQVFYRTEAIAIPPQLTIKNSVLVEKDRFHRSLLLIEYDRRTGAEYGEEFTALIFSAAHDEQVLDLTDVQGLLRVRDFVWQGVLHIWIGIDHVLFLIALLLTAVLVQPKSAADRVGPPGIASWRPVGDFKSAFWNIVKIVTTFTIAHSVTLSLAALDIVRLPSQLVESIIALSIVLVAINNLIPRVREGHWLVIFFFGLFHGMGFASVMGELPFRMMNLVKVILAFNIGVELGQLAIVAAVFPIIFLLRRSRVYKPVVLVAGSIAIALISGRWFIERAFDL